MPRYMTREGYQAIEAEIHHLWHVERPEIVDSVHEAASLGDRSENAAYIYGKKRLRAIDGRLRYLRRKIDDVTVVNLAEQPSFPDVRFGARVTVLVDDEEERVFRLVDKEESDPARGRISIQSPVGRALMGKSEGDIFEVRLPKGEVCYEVLSVAYGADES